jgi:hypothetical protein
MVAVIIAFILISPMETTDAQSSSGSKCSSDAMTVAFQLSREVNQENLPNLNSSSTGQQIASEINTLDPLINGSLQISVPPLNGSLKGLSVLVTPFDDFLNASAAVNLNDPGSACNFLAATFTLAADVNVLVVGNASAQAVIVILNVAARYCDSSCVLTVANSVGNFISAQGPAGLQVAWKAAYSIWSVANCAILDQCATTTTTPEFPYQSLGLLIFISLAATAFIASRRDRSAPGQIIHSIDGLLSCLWRRM